MLKGRNNWTWEQTLVAMVIKQSELNEEMTDKLNDAIPNHNLDSILGRATPTSGG
jgi:hypothetical protein